MIGIRRLLLLTAVASATGCFALFSLDEYGPPKPPSARDRQCDPDKPFGPGRIVEGINTVGDDNRLSLSPDELIAYVSRTVPGVPGHDFFIATRLSRSAPFSDLRPISEVNTPGEEDSITITSDGLAIYFDSQRVRIPDASTASDIYVARRDSPVALFGPTTLVAELSTERTESDPFIVADESAIYFLSQARLHESRRVSGVFQTPTVAVYEIEGGALDRPVASPNNLVLYYSAGHDGGAPHIYRATRASLNEPFGGTTQISSVVVEGSLEQPVWISPDDCRLYFLSTREGGPGGRDLYVTERPL